MREDAASAADRKSSTRLCGGAVLEDNQSNANLAKGSCHSLGVATLADPRYTIAPSPLKKNSRKKPAEATAALSINLQREKKILTSIHHYHTLCAYQSSTPPPKKSHARKSMFLPAADTTGEAAPPPPPRRLGSADFGYTFLPTAEREEEDLCGEMEPSTPHAAGVRGTTAPTRASEREGGQAPPRRWSGLSWSPKRRRGLGQGDKDGSDKGSKGSMDDDPHRQPSRAADPSRKPYRYVSPHGRDRGFVGGVGGTEDGVDGSDAAAAAGGAATLAACCCCLSSALLCGGGIALAWGRYASSSAAMVISPGVGEGGGEGGTDAAPAFFFAGAVLLILSAAALLLGCGSCCVGCVAGCAAGRSQGSGLDGLAIADGGEAVGRDVPRLEVRRLNDTYERAEVLLLDVHLDVCGDMKEVKEAKKAEEKQRKDEEMIRSKELERRVKTDLEAGIPPSLLRRNLRPVAFLVRFEGDEECTGMELLRTQVSFIVHCGRPGVDHAVFVVTSPGGAVSSYGLASSQLARIRKVGIRLTVCVDTVAASGGYMMASVGDTICAGPFAAVGSIGVVVQVPNIQRFLNRHSVDAYLFTAGEHKRTVDLIGDVTPEGKLKMQEELDAMHRAFKDHVALARPRLSDTIEQVGTGEYWLAVQAKELGLVDEIMTSDEYLESIAGKYEIVELVEKRKRRAVWSGLTGLVRSVRAVADGVSMAQRLGQPPAPMAVASYHASKMKMTGDYI